MGEDVFKEAHLIPSETTSGSLKMKFPGMKVYLLETLFLENLKIKVEYCSKLDMFNLDFLGTDCLQGKFITTFQSHL